VNKDTIEFHAGRLTKLERYIRTHLLARELAQASGQPVGVAFLELDELPCPVCEIRKAFQFG
jgi:hypothetical protein